MKFRLLSVLALATVVVAMNSCKKDDPVEPVIENEEEVITTLNFTLTPDTGGDAVVFSFQDLDGDGGNAATIDNGILAANTMYTGALELLNETESPAEDITEEEGRLLRSRRAALGRVDVTVLGVFLLFSKCMFFLGSVVLLHQVVKVSELNP